MALIASLASVVMAVIFVGRSAASTVVSAIRSVRFLIMVSSTGLTLAITSSDNLLVSPRAVWKRAIMASDVCAPPRPPRHQIERVGPVPPALPLAVGKPAGESCCGKRDGLFLAGFASISVRWWRPGKLQSAGSAGSIPARSGVAGTAPSQTSKPAPPANRQDGQTHRNILHRREVIASFSVSAVQFNRCST